MTKRLNATTWRKTFLRTLSRTGNVRVSAAEAGVDAGTAYDHRVRDAPFAAKWAAALASAKALRLRSGQAKRKQGAAGELVLRRTKHGDQMVRAAAGRWCAGAEAVFFEALMETACVRSAALACGFSANALYQRREAYPEFAEKWDRVLGQAKARIPDMLAAATIASLDPGPSTRPGRRGLPKVNVDQAIRISAIEQKRAAAPARRGIRPRVATNEEVREELLKRLKAFGERVKQQQREERLAEGWSRTQDGHLIPPGWIYVGTDAQDAGKGDDHT